MRRFGMLRLLFIGVGSLVFVLALHPAGASSANISHSYKTTSKISDGSLVSLDPDRTEYVIAANTDNARRLVGVAVASNDSLLAVDPDGGGVQVATSGSVNVLVSTLNGSIKVGDQIAVSPFNGVGMKSQPGLRIIGLAQTAFSAGSDGAVTREVTDKDGNKTSVQIGFVKVSIGIGTASSSGTNGESGLQRFARSLTGHSISTPRIILSIIVATVAAVALVTLIYASIYGSIISVGRNPLARGSIYRTLGSVLGMAAMTGLLAALVIFLLLR